jgi:hypothetical protein
VFPLEHPASSHNLLTETPPDECSGLLIYHTFSAFRRSPDQTRMLVAITGIDRLLFLSRFFAMSGKPRHTSPIGPWDQSVIHSVTNQLMWCFWCNWLHGRKSFLISWQSLRSPLMESECSLSCSHEPASRLCYKPSESSRNPQVTY